jgi:FkbH-like protein
MDRVQRLLLGSELFSDQPRASAINELLAHNLGDQQVGAGIRVWQNHSASLFVKAIEAYGVFSGLDFDLNDDGYDDAFTWHEFASTDIHVVWVDVDRLVSGGGDARQWFATQLAALQSQVEHDILVVVSSQVPDTARVWAVAAITLLSHRQVFNVWGDESELPADAVIDLRMVKVGGTYVSMKRQIQIARDVFRELAAVLPSSPKKLVVLDLDWTMYSGVLLEDGVQGITFEAAHIEMWAVVRKMFDSGVMLGIASKNDVGLVEELFREHQAVIKMELNQFIGVEAHFGSKTDSISRMIDLARTTPRDAVFVDDNVGEIAQVLADIPDMNVVIGNMGSSTVRWLTSIPGFTLDKRDANAATRVADIRARAEREGRGEHESNHHAGSADVLNQLGLEVDFRPSQPDDLDRIIDMIARTNQFNANLVRFDRREVLDYVKRDGHEFITATLRDKFVDSGIIFAALVAVDVDSSQIVVDSLVMSCRAMGRGLEPVIVWGSLVALAERMAIDNVRLTWSKGPRNQPFFDFLSRTLPAETVEETSKDSDSGNTVVRTETLRQLAQVGFRVKTYIEE